MRRIDTLHWEFRFAGARMLRDLLAPDGVEAGRSLVATRMKRLGVDAPYPKPSATKPAAERKSHPDLLRKPPVTPPIQVRAIADAVRRQTPTALFQVGEGGRRARAPRLSGRWARARRAEHPGEGLT